MNILTQFEVLKDYLRRSGALFVIDSCSRCKYPLGFVYIRGKLHFDSGCDCIEKQILQEISEAKLLKVLQENNGDEEFISAFTH